MTSCSKKMSFVKFSLLLFVASIFLNRKTDACLLHRKHNQFDFIGRWREHNKTLYDGNSIKELIEKCPNGCDAAACATFPVHMSKDPVTGQPRPSASAPCNAHDIKALREAQKIAKGWDDAIRSSPNDLIVHTVMAGIIILLIILLIARGHYRVRDLWFLPADRQWELERDPTWGLPGKVWGLLQMRVVKSENLEPTDRKYQSYTDNPSTLGEKFWYYKQALRNMYKTHKYYKRNRYFHKLSWQFNMLGKIIPETLRRHKITRRRAGELEEQRSNASSGEADPQENLPWELDLPDEINIEALKKVKGQLHQEIKKAQEAGRFINGRLIQHHHHHHHNHHQHVQAANLVTPLTKEEVENAARQMEVDPHADFVNVDGVMIIHPSAISKEQKKKIHQQHRHHHHHMTTTPTVTAARPFQKGDPSQTKKQEDPQRRTRQ